MQIVGFLMRWLICYQRLASTVKEHTEPRHENTGFLPMRKQIYALVSFAVTAKTNAQIGFAALKLRSFKSSEHINEESDGPYRGFGYSSLFSDPLDLATCSQRE